jgi:hypothetical protein
VEKHFMRRFSLLVVAAVLTLGRSQGATGKSYLVYPGDQGKRGDADFDGHVGGYQDVYVKTPQGWRFKSRVHVFPPQIPGEYKGIPNTKLEAGGDK